MIPYLRSSGENTISCDIDLAIVDERTPIVISLIDYGVKTKKICADIYKKSYGSITLEDREDITFTRDLSWYNSSFNYKNDRQGDLTHTIIKNKNIDNYIIDWNNVGINKSVVNYLRNKEFLPITEKIVENILTTTPSLLKEIDVFTNNPMFENLRVYHLNIYWFKEKLKSLSINDSVDTFNWDEIETIDDYIFTFLEPIKDKISETVKVLYNPKVINQGVYSGKKKPFKGQLPIIQGGIEVLKKDKFLYIGAEMGFGKSISSIKTNHNYFKEKSNNNYTTLLLAPAITLSQWKEEIKEATDDKIDVVTIRKIEDFIKWQNNSKKGNKPTYLLIGKETFKLSYAKEPNYKKTVRYIETKELDDYYKKHGYYTLRDYMFTTKKRRKDILICPSCGVPLKNPNRTTEDIYFEENDFKKPNKGNYKCSNCGDVLWSATYNKTKKTSVIDYIHRKGIIFDSVIVDEMQESNNSGSIIGNATRTILREHCKKAIALSGTNNNGYASSLHNILMAIFPNKLKEDNCLDVKDFVKKYGTLQAVTPLKDERRSYYSRGKSEIKDSDFKEIEGINPIVFTKYLVSNSIFATLDDLGKDLPPLNEIYVPITPDVQQKSATNKLFEDIRKASAFNSKMYVDSIVKHYINNPYEWTALEMDGTDGNKHIIQPIELDLEVLPKELELIKIAKQEKSEGRKVWIYTDFNNGGEYMKSTTIPNRLQKLLEAEGLKVFQLKASISTYDRKEVIEKNKDKYDVFISNAKLIKVGINLVFCPTYIFYMPSYMVNEVSQASRRGYRSNSTLENRIYHLYYEDTWEDIIIKRYQRKLAESKAINGQFEVVLEDDKTIRTASQFSSKLNTKIK